MINPNSQQNEKVIFPEDNALIITDLLQKYGLRESPKDILKKIRQKLEPNGKIIGRIARGLIEKKITSQELAATLKKELRINLKNAKELAKDLQEKLISQITDSSRDKSDAIKKSPVGKGLAQREKPAPNKSDIYREKID